MQTPDWFENALVMRVAPVVLLMQMRLSCPSNGNAPYSLLVGNERNIIFK